MTTMLHIGTHPGRVTPHFGRTFEVEARQRAELAAARPRRLARRRASRCTVR